MPQNRRRSDQSRIQDLIGALDRTVVVSPERFFELIDGLMELAADRSACPSVLACRPPDSALELRDLVSALLLAEVRSVDVVSWIAPDTVAILLDADAAGVMELAQRLQRVFLSSFPADPCWIGTTTASELDQGAEAMVALALDALADARDLPGGGISSRSA